MNIEHGAFKEIKVKSVGQKTESIETSVFPEMTIYLSALTEYRCSCGRLLGRFNGQAEIKCPKCRKINMIVVNNCANSGIAKAIED